MDVGTYVFSPSAVVSVASCHLPRHRRRVRTVVVVFPFRPHRVDVRSTRLFHGSWFALLLCMCRFAASGLELNVKARIRVQMLTTTKHEKRTHILPKQVQQAGKERPGGEQSVPWHDDVGGAE